MTTDPAHTAVARIIRDATGTDPEVTATHILTALRGHGWRPTAATPPVPPPAGPAAPPATVHAIAAEARAAITRENTT